MSNPKRRHERITSKQQVRETLSQIPLFQNLPPDAYEQLSHITRVDYYDQDMTVFLEGESGDKVYIIVFGQVKIFKKRPELEETVLRTAGLGEIFGEMSILDGLERSAGVVAIKNTLLLSITKEDFLEFLKTNPEVALKLLETVSIKLRNTNELLLDRRQMEEKLRYLAQHDPLTGLYNRAFFQEELQHLDAEEFLPVGLIICDVDGLKLINDTLGHDAGDSLLIAAASVIRKCFRDGDRTARVGGDEYAVLLPNSPNAVVKNGCNRVRGMVTEYNLSNPTIPLSLSVGFAIRKDLSTSMNDLFKEADANMYREKLYNSKTASGVIVQNLLKTALSKDFQTNENAHSRNLVALLGRALGLSEHNLAELDLLTRFHDIGNVGIPKHILFKKVPLLPEELVEIQRHCEIGYRIANSVPILAPIADWIFKHHEWWDGTGYPLGLQGEQIPLECRIHAVCDAYVAMTNNRPYRQAKSHREAVDELKKYAGIKFDPNLIMQFIQLPIQE